MKIITTSLLDNIKKDISISELSEKLFQLGHEHEIDGNIINFELTPNRGDCLSVRGLLRDLRLFYDIQIDELIYEDKISDFNFSFTNRAKEFCPKISFLCLEIDKIPELYCKELESYFSELDIKKNNFFTDVSNYISYETGQPTHCYDYSKIGNSLRLDIIEENYKFESLTDKTIELSGTNLAFFNKDNEVINLAGIIGGKSTACSKNTKTVLIECAYFRPEVILGKTVKYGVNSEAAHKFERNTDPNHHEYVLRRFLKIIEEHAKILNVALYQESNIKFKRNEIYLDIDRINMILGTEISKNDCLNHLSNLGFNYEKDSIFVPSHRHDITSENDICEEIARAIGYDNIKTDKFLISKKNKVVAQNNENESKIKNILIENGFFEVINDPFVGSNNKLSIEVDNPLDTNRKYLRTNIRDSLLENLQYNERRQKDIIKLFEIADIYKNTSNSNQRFIGIIASGRVDNNYNDFTKKIDNTYLDNLLKKYIRSFDVEIIHIDRSSINSKFNTPIVYVEFELDESVDIDYPYIATHSELCYQYKSISEFPSSKRDLSFAVKDSSSFNLLQEFILSYKNDLLKDVFIFDYFLNEKKREIKIGFRLIFQNNVETITDSQVNDVMDDIIKNALVFKGVTIPGM